MKWLKTFSSINHVAMLKILKKFMKNYFHCDDNTLKKSVAQYIRQQPFRHSKELTMLTRDIIIFYSKAFTHDDTTGARKLLN
jgi:SPX domain protein involved in polyphosphate accumulation